MLCICSILCMSNETHSAESTWLGRSVVSNEPGVWSLILIEIGLVRMGTDFLSLLLKKRVLCKRQADSCTHVSLANLTPFRQAYWGQ